MNSTKINRVLGQIRRKIYEETGIDVKDSTLLELNRISQNVGRMTKKERLNKLNKINNEISKQGGIGKVELSTITKNENRRDLARGQIYKQKLISTLKSENPNIIISNRNTIEDVENISHRLKNKPKVSTNYNNRNLEIVKSNVSSVALEIKDIFQNILKNNHKTPQTKHFTQQNEDTIPYLIAKVNLYVDKIMGLTDINVPDTIIDYANNMESSVLTEYFISGSDSEILIEEVELSTRTSWNTYTNEDGVNKFVQSVETLIKMLQVSNNNTLQI